MYDMYVNIHIKTLGNHIVQYWKYNESRNKINLISEVYKLVLQKGLFGAGKSTVSEEDLRTTRVSGLKPTVTPAPGASTPSSGLHGYFHSHANACQNTVPEQSCGRFVRPFEKSPENKTRALWLFRTWDCSCSGLCAPSWCSRYEWIYFLLLVITAAVTQLNI